MCCAMNPLLAHFGIESGASTYTSMCADHPQLQQAPQDSGNQEPYSEFIHRGDHRLCGSGYACLEEPAYAGRCLQGSWRCHLLS